jgi:addiction module HigA family antidote
VSAAPGAEPADIAVRRLRAAIERHPTGRVKVHAVDLRLALARIVALEHVAAGNKQHVQVMYRDLVQAHEERDAAVAKASARVVSHEPGLGLGELITSTLADAGLSQAALARRTDTSTKHISQLVTGKAHLSAAMAFRLEAALGVDAAEWMRAEITTRRLTAEAAS